MVFTICALLLAGGLGYTETGNLQIALSMLFSAAVLGVMETSLSLDNAVVNATILKDMDRVWQGRFLTWGMIIAVFGMRVIFPLLIVSISAMVSPIEATRIALFDHALYEKIVTGAHIGISGFGGAFLMLVGLTFFLDGDREHLWIPFFEKPLTTLARIPHAPYIVTLGVALASTYLLIAPDDKTTFGISVFAGIATFFAVEKLGDWMGGEEDATGKVVRTGLAAFVYLEFLDASFSFDGVIGAFAITNDIVLIALGLGIGAMFVRSMTVALVRGGHLSEYRFLEPGAFYAILALAVIMFVSTRIDVPEVVTGLIGAGFIGAAFLTSVAHRKRFPEEYAEDGDEQVILPTGDVTIVRSSMDQIRKAYPGEGDAHDLDLQIDHP